MIALNAVGQLFIAAKATEARHTRLPQPIRYPRHLGLFYYQTTSASGEMRMYYVMQHSQWFRNAVKGVPNWGIPDDMRLYHEAVHARFEFSSFLTPIASGSS